MDKQAAKDHTTNNLIDMEKFVEAKWADWCDTDKNAVFAAWYYALALAKSGVDELPDGEYEKLTKHECEMQLVEEGVRQVNLAIGFMEVTYMNDPEVACQSEYLDGTWAYVNTWIKNPNNYIGKPLKRNPPDV